MLKKDFAGVKENISAVHSSQKKGMKKNRFFGVRSQHLTFRELKGFSYSKFLENIGMITKKTAIIISLKYDFSIEIRGDIYKKF